jgi:MacB-like periplasmic core domain
MSAPVWMIRLASLLVPDRRREEWVREWLSELHYAELHYAQARAGEVHALAFASGAFHDAVWQHRDFWTLDRISRRAQSAKFCLGSLAAVVAAIVVASGFLPTTRGVLMPLPYRDAQNIVTVAQSRTMAMRVGVPGRDVQLWRESSKSIEDIATYRWEGDPAKPAGRTPLAPPSARVSRNFFHLLGAKTNAGRSFERDAVAGCAAGPEECVILSYDFWRGLNGASRVTLDGKSYRVAAVLEPGFWFLSPRIAVWRIGAPSAAERTGVVARLRPDVTKKETETELGQILTDANGSAWESLFEITGVAARVRYPLWSFALGLGLAIIIILPSLRLRMPSWNPRAAAFFAAKTGLLLAGVLICGIEFTHATSITMLGGTDLSTEPLSTWLFMLGSMGVLVWSIADQRRRCRVCLRRLGMAAHVGCPGCLLLNWAGTELVCMEGHGMLHVPEMAACWQDPDRWTSLDDSWQELFERS